MFLFPQIDIALTLYFSQKRAFIWHLTNTSGWFSSPNFPANYPDNIQCGWNISIPAGYKIYLNFLDFDLEDCVSSCSCDYVEVSNFYTVVTVDK